MILSRRAALLGFASTAALAACGPRGALFLADVPGGRPYEIFVGTARTPDKGPNGFGPLRDSHVSYGRFVISVPSERAPGTVVFPKALPPDPKTDFFTLEAVRFRDEDAFLASINARLAGRPAAQRSLTVFTHGFNTNFAEGLFRQAQMMTDFNSPGVGVHFAWPSAAGVRAYAYDRESAIFARDALQKMLEGLSRTNSNDILVAAHSMGAMVLMETLRSMALAGSPRFFEKLRAVVLIAPDVDVDVFRAQAIPIAAQDVQFYIFYSTHDRALLASAILRGGGSQRLGRLTDPAMLEGLPVELIDTSTAQGTDKLGHFALATSPALIAMVRGMNEQGNQIFADAAHRPNLFEATVNAAQGVAEAVAAPLTGASAGPP
jgi:esterase/lipase superfamily enzyme